MDPHAQAILAYGRSQKSRRNLLDAFQAVEQELKKPIPQGENDRNPSNRKELIGDLVAACLNVIKDDLPAFGDLLKQRGMAPQQAVEELEKYASALQDEVNKHRVGIDSGDSSYQWDLM